MKKFIIAFLSLLTIMPLKLYANESAASMIKSMQLEGLEEISIADEQSVMTFNQLAEYYADIITDKNAAPERLEALGNMIRLWTKAVNENFTKEELYDKYSVMTSTLYSMSIHLILRIAVKDENISAKETQKNIYET